MLFLDIVLVTVGYFGALFGFFYFAHLATLIENEAKGGEEEEEEEEVGSKKTREDFKVLSGRDEATPISRPRTSAPTVRTRGKMLQNEEDQEEKKCYNDCNYVVSSI